MMKIHMLRKSNGKNGVWKMNKYQEALDFIIINSCPSHVRCVDCNIEKNCNNLVKNKIDILQELVDKQEKYKWHDLIKDHNDKPQKDGFVLVMFKGEYKPIVVSCLNGEFGEYVNFQHFELDECPTESYFEFYEDNGEEIIAWRYIDEFER